MFTHTLDDRTDLRILEMRDAEDVFALMSAERSRHAELDDSFSLDDVKSKIKKDLDLFAEGKGLGAGIFYDRELAGAIRYHEIDLINRSTELGYWVGAAFEGKGLVTKACRAFIAHAFDTLELNRIVINCAAENIKSRAVPERLGFVQESIARQAEWIQDHFADVIAYSMLKDDWRTSRHADFEAVRSVACSISS